MTTEAESVRDGRALDRLAAVVNADMPSLLIDVADRLRSRWPDYADFLDDNRSSVSEAAVPFLRRLLVTAQRELDDLEPLPPEAEPGVQMVFEQIGRLHFREGRELAELLPAYRLGARAAWSHVSAAALRLDLPPRVLASLGEAVFEFVDQLGSASANGFTHEQSKSSAERERLRHELAEMLLSDRSDTAAVHAAAERACWPLAERAALILVDPAEHSARAVLERLNHRCLPVRQAAMVGAIVPADIGSGGRAEIARMVRGAHAVVGQVVSLPEFPASVRLPQIALDLQSRGLLAGDPVFVDEHLDTIIVHRDANLIGALRRQLLRPLEELPPATRARLIETLSAWLRHMGDRSAVADELFIHPQTVRYRMSQLREYFGAELDSPRGRARMLLALEWDRTD